MNRKKHHHSVWDQWSRTRVHTGVYILYKIDSDCERHNDNHTVVSVSIVHCIQSSIESGDNIDNDENKQYFKE